MHKLITPPDSRQGGAEIIGASLAIWDDEFLQRVERLRNNLRHISECWDNRLVLEDCSPWESYVNGSAEIVIHGHSVSGSGNRNWAVRIPSASHMANIISTSPGIDVFDISDGHSRQEIVVLVFITEPRDGPQIKVRVPARFYVLGDELRGIGEGFPYRFVGIGGFQVFPFLSKGEINLFLRSNTLQCIVHPVIERFPKVVDRITHYRAKIIFDWLFGPVGQIKAIWLSKNCNSPGRNYRNFIQFSGEGGRIPENRVNMAIGPFDL